MKTDKQRLDMALVERGLAESRAKAQRLIYAGQVRVDGQLVSKPSQQIKSGLAITVTTRPRFVSRGGDKLEHALNFFVIDVAGKICLDTGASTGGFTDCLLQRGAKKVFAVDVGVGQLHWKLLKDPRVIVMNKTNARYLTGELFPARPQLAVIDVSFISLTKVLPAVINALTSGGVIIALVKPQFEAERSENQRGVVNNPEVHQRVLEKIKQFGIQKMMLEFKAVCESPLKGPAGNVEFFIYWTKPIGADTHR
ncbi:MAG: TlyA family RNA methyltransferase [Kiritimatiellia bacterium]|nr:TlyA family RNA methyltransferase [Kiritimatiellia bacterium]